MSKWFGCDDERTIDSEFSLDSMSTGSTTLPQYVEIEFKIFKKILVLMIIILLAIAVLIYDIYIKKKIKHV